MMILKGGTSDGNIFHFFIENIFYISVDFSNTGKPVLSQVVQPYLSQDFISETFFTEQQMLDYMFERLAIHGARKIFIDSWQALRSQEGGKNFFEHLDAYEQKKFIKGKA